MTLAFDVATGSAAATLFTAPSDAARRAALATLAAAGPAVRIPLPGGDTGWLVTGYAHVRGVLIDPHVVKQLGLFGGPFTGELPPGVATGLFRHMLNADPPEPAAARSQRDGDLAELDVPADQPIGRSRIGCAGVHASTVDRTGDGVNDVIPSVSSTPRPFN